MQPKNSVSIFLSIAFIEGVISLIWLILLPGEANNIWRLGLSKERSILFLSILIAIGIAAYFTHKTRTNQRWHQQAAASIDDFLSEDGHKTTLLVSALFGVILGAYVVVSSFTTTDMFVRGYFIKLAPLMFWLAAFSLQIILFSFWETEARKKYFRTHSTAVFTLLIILILGFFVHSHLWTLEPADWDTYKIFNLDGKFDLDEQDIKALFDEGTRLRRGENPYARVLEYNDDMKWNHGNATYLPIFFYFAWMTQEIGLEDIEQWLDFWRVVFLIANLGITYLLFYVPYHRYKNLPFAVLAALFWLFNRWTLHMTMIYQIDFLAIFFLVLSLALWPKHRTPSLLAFGLSLGIKQIAIFMIPLYMIWIWHSLEQPALKKLIKYTLVMGSVPLIVSAPFILWNADGFFKSILLSATRVSESHFGVPSFDTLLGLFGIPAKLPLLIMLAVTFSVAWKKKLKPYAAALFIIIIFINFNSVLFRQYMTWAAPLVVLAVSETLFQADKENSQYLL